MRAVLLASTILSFVLAAPAAAQAAAPPPAAAPATATATAAVPVPLGKLDHAVVPSAYRLDLTVDPSKERFSGTGEVDAVVRDAGTRSFYLHGRDLTITAASALVGGRRVPAKVTTVDGTGVLRLDFAEALPAGKTVLAFAWDAAFASSPAGMFRVKVGDDWYSWTQFQSIDGRAAFPGFDEPGFKTPFTVTLRTPPGLVAVSNAPETGKTSEGGMDVHRFAPTLPLPTYLVAMMVGPFAVVEGAVPPTPQRAAPLPLRIVSTKENAGRLAFALEGSKGIVTHLEDYFGQPFPYPKLDQITSPIMPGAMENAGADLYNDQIIVLDDKSSTEDKRTFGMVVAHELAHQWFGDLVTPAWWDDIWLNESFANWMGFRIGNQWRPDLNIGAGALEEGFSAMGTDALIAGRPIHQPIARNSQIDEAFDSITYGKGGHVVAMIAAYMGDTKFRDGVRSYMAAHKYGNATSRDFFAAMAQAAGDPRIIPAMQSFTDQQGVPLVTFAKGRRGGYTISQSRYVRLGTAAPAQSWGIPVCVRQGAATGCQLLTDPSAPLAAPAKGTLFPNAGGTGYYRFELPRADWNALIAGADKLPGSEALALSDSLFASYRAGRASPDQLIAAGRKLNANPDSYARSAAFSGLEALDYLGFYDAPAQAAYRRLLTAQYAPQLQALGLDLRAGAHAADPAERSQARVQLVRHLVYDAHDAPLRKSLAAAAQTWLGGDAAALDPAFHSAGFTSLIEAGGLPAVKSLAERALASPDASFRASAFGAIGSSGDPAIARWALDEFKDTRLRRPEELSLLSGVLQKAETRDFGFEWLLRNFAAQSGPGGGIFFASRLPGMLGGFCSAEKADLIASELQPRLAGKTGGLELQRLIERVRSCGVLKTARAAETSRALARLK